jgi:hypothetical protein
MLASITPLGERSRQQRWAVTVSALILGSTIAAGALGAALAAAGRFAPLDGRVRVDLLLLAAVVAVVLELAPFGLRLPTHRRQVDESWLHRYRGWVYGIGFGAQLGVGVATVVATPAVYVAFVAEDLARDTWAGLAIGATFGLVRGASVLSTARVDSTRALAAFHRRFQSVERTAAIATVASQLAIIVTATAFAL